MMNEVTNPAAWKMLAELSQVQQMMIVKMARKPFVAWEAKDFLPSGADSNHKHYRVMLTALKNLEARKLVTRTTFPATNQSCFVFHHTDDIVVDMLKILEISMQEL